MESDDSPMDWSYYDHIDIVRAPEKMRFQDIGTECCCLWWRCGCGFMAAAFAGGKGIGMAMNGDRHDGSVLPGPIPPGRAIRSWSVRSDSFRCPEKPMLRPQALVTGSGIDGSLAVAL
eukprot:s810_g28.t1